MSDRFSLPDEIRERFITLSEQVGATHRALGRVVDEYVSEVQHGQHMAAYELFADLYRQTTGETISPRTIRAWRQAATLYSKHELTQFETLSDSQLIEAVNLAEIAKIDPQAICEWAVANQVSTVPAMRANWLPVTSTEYRIDPPVISGMIRYGIRMFEDTDPRRTEWDALVTRARELVASLDT